ncbi:MAG: VCBS domain-containing protein, partial [Planctomycetia bacterium]|nr:VCBS domain-containing protein [Planctomycetia bacterium]
LTLLANGDYAYVVNDANAAVQALVPGATLLESFTYSASNGTTTVSAVLRITIYGANDAATMTSVGAGPLATGTEDTRSAITFAMIRAAANAADLDGTVAAFVVRSVAGGTLLIGATPETAAAWNTDSNAVIDATHNAYWTPDANATGTQAAFAVVARDDGGLDSDTPLTITIDLDPVNDAPAIAPVAIGFTDAAGVDVFTAATGTLVATDVESSGLTFGITGVTPEADVFTLAGSYGTLTVNRLTGAYTFAPNDTAINAATGEVSETFPIFVSDAAAANSTGAAVLTVTIGGVPERPTLPAFTAGATPGTEDTTTEVLFSELLSRGDAGDIDGTVTAFVVTAVRSGRLAIGTSAATAIAWNAETNALITAELNGYWTPDADAYGSLDAFAVVARDDSGIDSTPAVDYHITVTPVNDAPSLTALSLAAGSTAEDTEVQLTFAAIAAAGDAADIDGTVTSFVVKAVSSGTLRIGADAATATTWNSDTNAVIGTGLNAYWTPATNASGVLDAFTVVARDDGGLESPVALPVQVSVSAVNDAAVISLPEPFPNQFTEDAAVDGQGFLSASGNFAVADQDAGEATFSTTVTTPEGQTNLGSLTVDAAGSYIYKALNGSSGVQALRAGATHTDTFIIRSVDGTTRNVSFQITGVADTLVGAVADGYLAGATLFADSNGNKFRDWTDAGGMNGTWDAGEGEAWTTTDASGNFSFDFGAPTAMLVTIGGTDISTGLPFVGVLSAPAGSTIVNPLTTLVAATSEEGSLTAAEAAEAVRTALGLPAGVNLTTYDPLAQTAGDATALQVQKVAANIANLIVVATNNSIDSEAALANLAGLINASPATTIDLESSTLLTTVLTVTDGGSTTPPPAAVVAGLTLVNTAVNDAPTIAAAAESQKVVQNGVAFTAPAFTSTATATFATGVANSFQFVATGYPAPTFSTTGTLPTGVTLTTAGLLSGTAAPGTAGVYTFTVTATNEINPAATQGFTLTVGQTDSIAVSVDANRILLSLAPAGVAISSLHTAYNARTHVLTITATQTGTMVASGAGTPGVAVNSAAKTISVNLGVLTGFAGISVVGNGGVDSVTIGGTGINLAAVTKGAANQSFSIDTKGGATDIVTVGKPITAKGSGSVSVTTLGTGASRGIHLGGTVTTATGSQTYAGTVNLLANTALTAGTGGAIGFTGTIDGANTLSLSAGGGITFAGAVGVTTPLKGLTVAKAAGVAVNNAFRLNGVGTAAGTSGLTIAANVNNVAFAAIDSKTNPRTITGFKGSGIRFLGTSTGSNLTGIASTGNGIGLEMAAGTYTGTVISANDFSDNTNIGVSLTNVGGLSLGTTSAANTISRNGNWGVYASGRLTGTQVQNNTLDANATPATESSTLLHGRPIQRAYRPAATPPARWCRATPSAAMPATACCSWRPRESRSAERSRTPATRSATTSASACWPAVPRTAGWCRATPSPATAWEP